MKSIVVVLLVMLMVSSGRPAEPDSTLAGKWESKKLAVAGGAPICDVPSRRVLDPSQDSRFSPQAMYSLDLKNDRDGKLTGSLTARSLIQALDGCTPAVVETTKYDILEGGLQSDGKTVTIVSSADNRGSPKSSIWRGTLMFPDVLVLRTTDAKLGLSDSEEILFHPRGAPRQANVNGTIKMEAGGPPPKFRLTFFNTSPIRVLDSNQNAFGGSGVPQVNAAGTSQLANYNAALSQRLQTLFGGRGRGLTQPGQPGRTISVSEARFNFDLEISNYRVEVLELPPGYTIKSITSDKTNLLAEPLSLPRDAKNVRLAITIGSK